MAKKHVKLSDQVRRAVDASGMSRYAICKALDMDQAIMSRFMTGRGGLSMANLDVLADMLGLNIVTTGKPPKIPKGRRGQPRKAR